MNTDGSVTRWLDEVKEGDESAARELWQRYFTRLVELARRELRGAPTRMADEEDVAASVFQSFCCAAEVGRFPDLSERESLWRLLIRMTARKAVDLRRHEARLRRGGDGPDRPRGASAIELAEVIGPAPSPEFAVMMVEETTRLLEKLGDDDLRSIVLARLEGQSYQEMADAMGCSIRTIERRMHLIREKWKQERSSHA